MRSVLTAVGLAVCLAQVASPSPRLWSEVRSPEHGFRVEFPGEAGLTEVAPGHVKWSLELDNGFTAFIAETLVLSSERVRSAGPTTVLDDAVAGGIKNLPGGTVLHQGVIELGGNQGRELVMRADSSGSTMRVTSRVFLVGTRLYLLVAVAKDENLDAAERDRFLKSFALISR